MARFRTDIGDVLSNFAASSREVRGVAMETEALEPLNWDNFVPEVHDEVAAIQLTASGKNSIRNSTVDPTASDIGIDGDRWQVWTTLESSGKLTATWRHDGLGWVKEALDESYLPLVNIGQGTYGELSGSRLIAKSVKADSLEAELVLASDIIAGDPAQTHARMTPQGFKVLASPDGVIPPQEVVRMGVASTDDYFSVTRADGTIAASVSSTGDVSAGNFVGDKVTLSGQDLQTEVIDPMPKGIVARAGRSTNSLYYAGTTLQPYLQVDFDALEGRMYMVTTTPIGMDSDIGGIDAIVSLHYQTGGQPAETSSTVIGSGISVQGSAATRRSPVTITRVVTPPAGPVSLLLSYGTVSAGRSKIVASNGRAVFITVEDMGAATPDVGIVRDGTGDAATGGTGGGSGTGTPAPKNYVKTYSATGIRSFLGNGATYNYNTSYMFFGLQPYTSNGDLSSMAVFPNFVSDLTGATVNKVEVYVYADFWYYGAGGSAYIGLHGQTGLTGSAPAKTYAHALSANWPRAAGRWVTLSTSTYAGFKNGTHRGITLGGSGGGNERYGYAHDPKIRISYTK